MKDWSMTESFVCDDLAKFDKFQPKAVKQHEILKPIIAKKIHNLNSLKEAPQRKSAKFLHMEFCEGETHCLKAARSICRY